MPRVSGANASAGRSTEPPWLISTPAFPQHLDAATVPEDELILLADAQTSGGLLIAGEVPGYPVIGELAPLAGPGMTTIVIK